jgi:ABC-type multidrug transport system ATPase subunit/ABC-type transporter Mla maintaining outer membrane lipid asymmetry permease subunit MlaE
VTDSSPSLAIELRDFGLAYRGRAKERIVFVDVDLSIPSGSFLLLVGESGSGKSTLLRLLCGLWESREPAPRVRGSVQVLGENVGVHYPRRLRGQVQAVLQDEGLLDELSPRGNVELALRVAKRSPTLALGLLAQVGLEHPPESVHELSGGMRKRVAVARALGGGPRLLFFDEPTAGLDAESARAIATLLVDTHRSTAGARTTIVITHDLRAFEGLHDGVLHIDPDSKSLRWIPPGEPIVDDDRDVTIEATVEPLFDLRGLQTLLYGAADFGATIGNAIWRVVPRWPELAAGTIRRYIVEAAVFVVIGCATVGGLAMFFALRNNPLEGAFTGALITGSGTVLVAVLIPLLAGFFFTARVAAGAAARLGTMKRTGQIDALRMMGIRPVDYLLIPLLWGVCVALPIVTACGIVFAGLASLFAAQLVSGISAYGWARAFIVELDRGDLRFVAYKALISGFLVAIVTYFLATGPKRSGLDVGRAVNGSIVFGMTAVLLVHAALILLHYAR